MNIFIYICSVIHLVIHFLLENNTNKEAAHTMHKDQIIVIQKKKYTRREENSTQLKND